MNTRYKKLRMGALQRQILGLTAQLEALAQAKGRAHHTPKPVPAEPGKTHEATTHPVRRPSPEATINPSGGIDMRQDGGLFADGVSIDKPLVGAHLRLTVNRPQSKPS